MHINQRNGVKKLTWYTTEDARRDALKQAERRARIMCADEIDAAVRSLQACPKSEANAGAISALQNQVTRLRRDKKTHDQA